MGLVGEWHENPILELPITIGTHPFEDPSPSPETPAIISK